MLIITIALSVIIGLLAIAIFPVLLLPLVLIGVVSLIVLFVVLGFVLWLPILCVICVMAVLGSIFRRKKTGFSYQRYTYKKQEPYQRSADRPGVIDLEADEEK